MPDILIKKVPDELHRRLKEEASRHHRSMARHALALLEEGLQHVDEVRLPPVAKTAKLLTQAVITRGVRKGRL